MLDINDLPDELLEFIFSYLPPYKDLEVCQAVCKRWDLLVKNVMRRTIMNLNKGLTSFRLCWKSNSNMDMTATIAGRFSHSAVVHENSMYVFGGCSSSDTTFNDLWRFDLSKRKWIRPFSTGVYPSPKGSASMVCYRDWLYLFGGWRYPPLQPPYQSWTLFDELHLYNIKKNLWSTVEHSEEYPPPMAGHSATVQQNKMVVFGGYQVRNDVNFYSNDVWCLDLEFYQWKKPKVSNKKPPPRCGQFQTALDDNNLLIMGGCGGPNNIFNDAWVLNISGEVWQWKNIAVKNKKWAAANYWCNPACKVGTKLVVLGPTQCEFEILRTPRTDRRVVFHIPNAPRRFDNFNPALDGDGENNRVPHNANNNNNNVNPNPANGSIRHLRAREANAPPPNPQDNVNNVNEDDAANRLQRNLALRPSYPVNYWEDRFHMAAFSVDSRTRSISRERHQERIRRMEKQMNALRNSGRNNIQKAGSPSGVGSGGSGGSGGVGGSGGGGPTLKKPRRSSLGMFICDISKALDDTDPCLEWMENKNHGIVSGAPERLILSTIVPGNGELIMFGGVHKETLSAYTHEVSNSVHFLTAPKEII